MSFDLANPLAGRAAVAVGLLVDQRDKLRQVGVRQHLVLELHHDGILKKTPVDQARIASSAPLLEVVLAAVVEELAALRRRAEHLSPAGRAVGQPAQQVLTGDAPRMSEARRSEPQRLAHPLEVVAAHEGGMRLLDADDSLRLASLRIPIAVAVEDRGPGVCLVRQHVIEDRVRPFVAVARLETLRIQLLGDLLDAHAVERHLEDALDHRGMRWLWRELRFLRFADLHLHANVAVGRSAAVQEAARGVLVHPAHGIVREVGRVELVHDLDHAFEKLPRRRAVYRLVDRNDLDAVLAKHGLVEYRVLAVAREARELPDQDHGEGRSLLLGEPDHSLELRAVRRSGAFRLIDELLDHPPALLVGVLSQRLELGRDGEVLLGLTFG